MLLFLLLVIVFNDLLTFDCSYSLCLHAYLQDSVTCAIIANIWLKNPSNFHVDGYRSLSEMYVVKVLCVSRRWDEVKPFLDSCLGLSESTRHSIARHVTDYRKELEVSSIEVLESDVSDAADNNHQTCDSTVGQIRAVDGEYCQFSELSLRCMCHMLLKMFCELSSLFYFIDHSTCVLFASA